MFKKNILYLLLMIVFSCKSTGQEVPKELSKVDLKKDSIIYIEVDLGYKKKYDSLIVVNLNFATKNDSLKVLNKKIASELLHKKLIIENAKFYLNIANKKPSQQKFLRGWMNRALNQ